MNIRQAAADDSRLLDSLAFHLNIGFAEVGRTIWFHKRLKNDDTAD